MQGNGSGVEGPRHHAGIHQHDGLYPHLPLPCFRTGACGRYYLDYSLDNNNQLIDAIEGHFDLYVGDKTILNIRMEAYYLEEMVENSEKGYAETNREFNEKVSLWDSFINFFS